MSLSIRNHKRSICRRLGATTRLEFKMPEPWASVIKAQGDPDGFIKRAIRAHLSRAPTAASGLPHEAPEPDRKTDQFHPPESFGKSPEAASGGTAK